MSACLELAQTLFELAQDDETLLATLVAARSELALQLANGELSGDIISGTTSLGTAFTQRINLSNRERLRALSIAINSINNGKMPTRQSQTRF